MKALELFAGSRSFGSILEAQGHEVFSVDWMAYEKIDLVADIEYLAPEQISFIPDYIHLSPDCATYSVAAFQFHRDGILPKSDYAKKCDAVNINALSLVRHYRRLNPRLIFTIENPRGMLRKMPFMRGIPRATVWYCRYGDFRAKPTDIWSNNIFSMFCPYGWNPRPECWNDNQFCHHEKVPRESDGLGTCRLPGSYERSIIPPQLCNEIIESVVRSLSISKTENFITEFDYL